MYVKINKPKEYNKGSCSALVDYLEKENALAQEADRQMFFSQLSNNISPEDVKNSIDNNKAKLGAKEDKYYMLSINPSQKELKHILRKVTGRNITEIDQLTKGEQLRYEGMLKEYAKTVMDEYAKNFNKGLSGEDLLYFGKVEHQRKYTRDCSEIIEQRAKHIKLTEEDLGKVFYEKQYYADIEQKNICHALKNGDQVAIGQVASEMFKNIPSNAILVPMPSSCGYATYTKDLCEALKKLNPSLEVSDILKCNERQKLYELKKEGKEVTSEFFSFHLNGELPKDKEIILVDNVLATGSTYKHAQEVIPNAKLSVYAINEDTEIKRVKIEQVDKLKDLNLPKIGDLKAGLNSHVHVVVSRKDISNTIKLSPFANARCAENKLPDGSEVRVGFDRKEFAQRSETAFDLKHGYKRELGESFSTYSLLKNDLANYSRQFANEYILEDTAVIVDAGEKLYMVGKGIADFNESIKAASTLANRSQLNFVDQASLSLTVNAKELQLDFGDLGTYKDIPKQFFDLNKTFDELVSQRFALTKGINDNIKEVHKAIKANTSCLKDAKANNLDTSIYKQRNNELYKQSYKLKAEKLNFATPIDLQLKSIMEHKHSILKNLNLSIDPSKVIHLNLDSFNSVVRVGKELESLSSDLKAISLRLGSFKQACATNKFAVSAKLKDVRASIGDIYSTSTKIDKSIRSLKDARNDLSASLRSQVKYFDIEKSTILASKLPQEAKLAKIAVVSDSLRTVRADLTNKIGFIDRTMGDLKLQKGNLFECAKALSTAPRGIDPLNAIRSIAGNVPGVSHAFKAMQAVSNPVSLVKDLALAGVNSIISAGMGV